MKRKILTLFIILIPAGVFGQLTPVTDQYILNPLSINPAYAGSRGALNIAAFYRNQWTGIKGAPETLTLVSDAPFLDEKIGVGFSLISDKYGVTRENHILTSYSYKMELHDGTLSLGLGAGLITTNTAYSDLVVLDPGDDFYLVDTRLFVVPHFSFGAYYTFRNHTIGLSVPKILTYSFNIDKNKYSMQFKPGDNGFLLNYGYMFNYSGKLKFFPSTLITLAPNGRSMIDVNAYVNYLERFWGGLSWRSGRSVAGLFQFQVNDQIKLAYSYAVDINKLGSYSNGSHEIMLRYEFRYRVNVSNPLLF